MKKLLATLLATTVLFTGVVAALVPAKAAPMAPITVRMPKPRPATAPAVWRLEPKASDFNAGTFPCKPAWLAEQLCPVK